MKRFTETEKWRDSWFRALPAISKLAVEYIYDNCDAAGVWDPDFSLADFCIGEKVNWIGVLEQLGDRVETLKNGKWHLMKFVAFQQGELSENCRPHQKIFALLKSHGIGYRKGIQRVSIPTNEVESNQVESVYSEYPRKVGKSDALKAITMALKKKPFLELLDRTKAYSIAVEKWPEQDRQFVPHPATWFNRGSYDDDPATWERSTPVNGQKIHRPAWAEPTEV
jgi:hypothetical protein